MANTAITTGGAATRSPRRGYRREDGSLLGYAMLAPAAILVGILILLPLAYSVFLSLYDWKLLEMNRPKRWSGLGNYWKLITDDGLHNAFVNTVIFMVGAVTVELVLGFVIALAVFHMTSGRRLANAIILLPMVITPVVTALLWRYMLDPQFGIVAQVMTALGGHGGIDVWGSSALALPGLMLVDIWQWTPFAILILHAGMLGISEEQFEAAAVDGAGHLRVAFSIILPAIVPQILVVLLFRSMDTYRIFDTVFVLTRGGPGVSSDTLGLFTFRNGFSYLQMGYAMALSVFLLVTVSIISAFYIRLLRRRGML
ncbi:MAG TPA: sugar ABC transporter permease [Bauldia sp.]|nr:sugar ABC transporter permease [Bauldia sp.]